MCENIIVYGDYTPLTANNLQDYPKTVDLLNTAKKIVNSCPGFLCVAFSQDCNINRAYFTYMLLLRLYRCFLIL